MTGQRKIAVGTDERTDLVDHVLERLSALGYETRLQAPARGSTLPWPKVAEHVATEAAHGGSPQGILFCWTGTGVCMAANKVPGIRAALCADAATASGARKWNDANVLVLSLRATSPAVAEEILSAWFDASPDPSEAQNIAELGRLEARAGHSES